MTRDKRPPHLRTPAHPVKIKWSARLPPALLKRLYEADARGIHDIELCDDVGSYLFARCETFYLVHRREVRCPACGTVFDVAKEGASECPNEKCEWFTDIPTYGQSVRSYYAHTGRAVDAFLTFYERYPRARTYPDKIILIDQLIHSYHLNATGGPGKSVASKLLEGNKKDVVAFLDGLSARDPDGKEQWRRQVARTIDARALGNRREA